MIIFTTNTGLNSSDRNHKIDLNFRFRRGLKKYGYTH